MKSIKTALALLAIIISTFNFAHANTPESTPESPIVKEIKNLLKSQEFTNVNQDETVYVSFMVNNNKELMVLNTTSNKYDSSIKHALNYEKIEAECQPMKSYVVPIKFKS